MAGAHIVFNHFPRLAGAMRVSAADVIFETAEGILDEAFATVSANSRRTGELADSGRTDYSDDGLEAIAGFDDFKAIWIEYGTGSPDSTRAEPFITPAAEHHKGRFESAMSSIEPRLRTNISRATVTSLGGHVKVAGQGINPTKKRQRR